MKISILLFLTALARPTAAFAQAQPPIDTVTVEANKLPLEQTVHNFIRSYAKPSPMLGKLARWSKGTPLCPHALGLQPNINVFVEERIRTVAGLVGAPLQSSVPCKTNMAVIFTPRPQELLDAIRHSRTDLLGYHFVAQVDAMTQVKYPIEAWYATATRDYNGVVRVDDPQAFDECVSFYGLGACSAASMGSRVKDGEHSEMTTVTVVVDTTKITGLQLGAIADYIAMLSLSQTDAFNICQPLASIANLMAPDCDARKAQSLTDADLAYLKALYRMDADVLPEFEQGDIARQMEQSLQKH
jgi:hypothetical protein